MNINKFFLTKYFIQNIIPQILKILLGIIILYISYYLANYIFNLIIKYAKTQYKNKEIIQTKQTNIAYNLLAQLSFYLIFLIGCLIILKLFGIETASIIAIFGALGFTIGLAIQGTLTDFISGIIMATQQNINIGDVIKFDNFTATVIDFTLINTILQDVDTLSIIKIPNKKFQEVYVYNYTHEQIGYVNLNIAISNSFNTVSYSKIFTIISNGIKQHKHVVGEAICNVIDMSKPYTLINVKVPILTKYYPEIYAEIHTLIRIELEKNNVSLATYTSHFAKT